MLPWTKELPKSYILYEFCFSEKKLDTAVTADSLDDEIVRVKYRAWRRFTKNRRNNVFSSLVSLTFLGHPKGAYPNRTKLFSSLLW